MNLTFKNIPAVVAAIALTMSASAMCEEKADAKGSTVPNIIKTEPAKVVAKGKPTLKMMGDTIVTTSGLKYIEVKPGTGGSPKTGQKVSVHYVGTLLDGKKFDSSRDRGAPYEFAIGVGQVIKGWDEGIASMKIGGVRKMIIPYALAYGEEGRGSAIPPKSTLVFEVELLGIK